MKIGVIISTYNNPAWLEKTLWGYSAQTRPADEIIIADDGSTEETRALINTFRDVLPIKHIWHEDNGFLKNIILNRAIVAAESEYLIFTDQDCVPRYDFVEVHEMCAWKGMGYFLSAGYFKLPLELSKNITKEDIISGRAFDGGWLLKNGLPKKLHHLKFLFKPYPILTAIFNTITTRSPTWNGCNASGWRDDIIHVNGFDNRMKYGGEDRELGERLVNIGIKPKQISYSAVTLHLDHRRPYVNQELLIKNKQYRLEVRRSKITETPNGIKELEQQKTELKQEVKL